MKPLSGIDLTLALLVTFAGIGAPVLAAPEPGDTAAAARAEKQATYCPGVRLFAGGIAIQSGRCYVLFVLRDRRGLFLAFAQPGLRIPPGQLVRLNTPAGAKVKGRIFYLVPIRASGLVVPVDHIVLTAIRVQEVGSRVVIILSPGGTRVTVGFERRP